MKKSKLCGINVRKDLKILKRDYPNKIREVQQFYLGLLAAQPKKISFVAFEFPEFPGQFLVVRGTDCENKGHTFVELLTVMHGYLATPSIKPKIRMMTTKQFNRLVDVNVI